MRDADIELADFRRSLAEDEPPRGLGDCLTALWWAGRQDWTQAHVIVQRHEGRAPAWVHAYLHRVEGDMENAHYWYLRAGRAMPTCPLQEEWTEIVRTLLQEQPSS